MKRSLTIGCVLLVGGGATNCGGVVSSSGPGQDRSSYAGASGAGTAGQGFMGDIPHYIGAGASGIQVGVVGVPVEEAGRGGASWVDPCEASWDPPCDGLVGVGGAGGDPSVEPPMVGAGAGPTAGNGGESGWTDEGNPGGEGPVAGSGGWLGIPPK